MRQWFTLVCCLILSLPTWTAAQNIDYETYITEFNAGNCGNDPGPGNVEEHTWNGWLSDDVNNIETFSGCVTVDTNGSTTVLGTYAFRSRFNVLSTQLLARIDAWEDDQGGRCDFDPASVLDPDEDDCRVNQSCLYPFSNPLEYQWTDNTGACGTRNYGMRLFYRYRYHTVSVGEGVDNSIQLFNGGGARPFWGSMGSWADRGGDCAVSGTIGDNQTSSFSTTVTCKRRVNFQWRTSSEANGDWLKVYINGVIRDSISGVTGWVARSFDLEFGDNIIEWRYVKNGSVSAGEDRAFVDDIVLDDALTILPGSITGNQEVCEFGDPSILNSTAPADAYSTFRFYQWEVSVNRSTWTIIGGARNLSYDPPSNIEQTSYYRRRVQDACGNLGYSDTIEVFVNPLPNGNLGNPPEICVGDTTDLIFTGTVGTGPFDIVYNGISDTGLVTGERIPVSPSATTNYNITRMTDDKGCVRTSGFGIPTTVVVNTYSTMPNIDPVRRMICPGEEVVLQASGGIPGSGSSIRWYTGPNGTGTRLGGGRTITVFPQVNSTYYARREGFCNTTPDDDEPVQVREIIYAPVGVTPAVDYCTDAQGWHHFFDANDDIIFSVQGDFSGLTTPPDASITNNGTHYQGTFGAVGSCVNGWSPGEERFEMPRAWNLEFIGTLNPPYSIRYYYPPQEQSNMEAAANNHMANNAACGYTYKYPIYANGFYWFKTPGQTYLPPQYDGPIKLNANYGWTANNIHYAQKDNLQEFSGGSGGIILIPNASLPVEMRSFTAWNDGASNTLQWITETELNNDRFEVERSRDGQNFEVIGTAKGAGTSMMPLTYLWEDQAPFIGVNYYRLRQVDFDGTDSYSDIVAVSVDGELSDGRFFPNPANNRLTYQFNSTQNEVIVIRMTDVLGRVLSEWNHSTQVGINTAALDLSALTAGTYLVTVYNELGDLIHSESIVKNNP